jgi:hypothetical protein
MSGIFPASLNLSLSQRTMVFAGVVGAAGFYYIGPNFVPSVNPLLVGAGLGAAAYYYPPMMVVGVAP